MSCTAEDGDLDVAADFVVVADRAVDRAHHVIGEELDGEVLVRTDSDVPADAAEGVGADASREAVSNRDGVSSREPVPLLGGRGLRAGDRRSERETETERERGGCKRVESGHRWGFSTEQRACRPVIVRRKPPERERSARENPAIRARGLFAAREGIENGRCARGV
jgi:hypothetical protein